MTSRPPELALADADFVVRVELVTDDEVVAGQVISQNPPAGTNHPPGTEIVLVVSAGPEQVVLSEYTGFTAIDALSALSNLGVQTVLEKEFHPTIPDGEVIRTDPPALSIIPKNQVVKLIVSLGIEPVAVPSLVGNTQAEAQNALAALGLSIAFGDPIEVTADSGQEGVVLAQSTPATVLVEPGTTITVQIGEVPPPPHHHHDRPGDDHHDRPVIAARREALLAWYDQHRRRLPWRDEADPYAILVSEIMAQQTQISRVVPHFERFIAEFPTVEALAGASLRTVLAAWSGLGYNRRARYLHEAARHLVEHGWPDSAAGLRNPPRSRPVHRRRGRVDRV